MIDEELFAMVFRGVRFTFSRHCHSGFVGHDRCWCKRCRRQRGDTASYMTEAIAEGRVPVLSREFTKLCTKNLERRTESGQGT